MTEFGELLRDVGLLYFVLVPASIVLVLLREVVSDWRVRHRRNARAAVLDLIGEDES